MDEREYSHGLGKKKTGYLYRIAELNNAINAADAACAIDAGRRKDVLTPNDTEDVMYSELSISDTALTEMWMELRV